MPLVFRLFKGLLAVALSFTLCFVLLQVVMYWLLADLVDFPTFSAQTKQWIMGGLENYLPGDTDIIITYTGTIYVGPGGVPSGLPVDGPIFCGFGTVTCADGYVYHNHTGIDIDVPVGTPVHSTIAGTVVYVQSSSAGYGNLVVVQNGDLQTFYAHNSVINVKVGDMVQAGQVVALSGSSGNSTGPHVHYEVRVNGTPVDPLSIGGSKP